MTLNDAKTILLGYDCVLERAGHVALKELDETNRFATLSHLRWMCYEVQGWYVERTEKAMRWVGYVQGVLHAKGIFSLEELKEHSRTRQVPR